MFFIRLTSMITKLICCFSVISLILELKPFCLIVIFSWMIFCYFKQHLFLPFGCVKLISKHIIWLNFFFVHSARFAYENCVYNSARAKCTPESAKFTKSLVELLSSERQFKNCGRIEGALCGAASTTGYFLYPIYIGFLITNLFCKLFVPT